MKQLFLEIKENIPLRPQVYKMSLSGDCSAIRAPGQFVNIKIDGLFLRRPLSVCDREGDRLTVLYKLVGKGTEKLSEMKSGKLDVLTGLGNGFDMSLAGERPLLIGGGLGLSPLYMLGKELEKSGKEVTAVLGFNTAAEVIYAEEFERLGIRTIICTADGGAGIKGFVTEGIRDLDYSYFYACGPEAMLRAVSENTKTEGELSFEARMGCGFGACMGCSCKTLTGYKRICKEGPVMKKEEIMWEA